MDLVFSPDVMLSQIICVNISIFPDVLVEDTEIFNITISTADASVIFSTATSEAVILDDSGKYRTTKVV